MITKNILIIMVYCLVASSPAFANGGLGGTGVNDSQGMGADYSLPSIYQEY